jgi:hypothetical protein
MCAQSDRDRRRPAASVAAMRDPIVPLDLGGWFRQVHTLFRRSFRGLAILAVIPVSISAVYWIVLDATRPSPAETRQRLIAAAAASPIGTVDPWTELRIDALPVLGVMVIFGVLIAVTTAVSYGGAYYLALRQANGQPATVADVLRAAAPRALPFIGWGALAFLPTMALSGLLLLPGMVTGSPWLEMIGPTLALLLVVAVTTLVLPTLLGVVFVERSGLIRCLHLVKRRFWLALGRTLVISLTYAAYAFVTTALVRLVLWPFGGSQAVSHPGLAAVHLLDAALAVPLVVYVIAATVVTYAELRFREDASTTTGQLAAEIRV